MKTLRVMVITTVPQTLAAFFPRQLRSLAEAGFEVHAVTSPGPDLDAISRIPGVTVHALPIERQSHPLRDIRSLLQIFRLIRHIRPQIVHSHTPKAGLLGMAAAKAAGVPVRLYTIHGLPFETRTGLWRRILEAAERTSSALSTRAYAVSPSLRQVVIDLKLCPASKLSTLGAGSCAGVDLDRFNAADRPLHRSAIRQGLSLPDSALLLSFVGRLGIGVLAQAWPEIARQLPDAHLLLAGDPDHTDPLPPGNVVHSSCSPSRPLHRCDQRQPGSGLLRRDRHLRVTHFSRRPLSSSFGGWCDGRTHRRYQGYRA